MVGAMRNMATATTGQDGAQEYVRLLLKLHELDPRGDLESEHLDSICEQMDRPWVQMSGKDRVRGKGLSQDLYALADGRQGVAMSPEERREWTRQADAALPAIFLGEVDGALHFLRRPFPNDLPPYTIPFLQARCWERLGEGEIALVFMKEAARLDPRQAVCVLLILERLGRTEEAAECAQRIIANSQSSAEELYQAAATLLRPTRGMTSAQAKPILQSLVPILERSLRVSLTTPREKREIPDTDRHIITMLGLCYERLGNVKSALQLYNDGLARYPGDADLLTFRGLTLIDIDLPRALADCRRAVQAGSPSVWPYYFLAWDALHGGDYAGTWQLCGLALQQAGGSNRERAQLYEWLGIALAQSGQPIDWVLYNLRQAQALDPSNERIRQNILVAEARRSAHAPSTRDEWAITGRASSQEALRGEYREARPAADLFVERSDASLAGLLQHA